MKSGGSRTQSLELQTSASSVNVDDPHLECQQHTCESVKVKHRYFNMAPEIHHHYLRHHHHHHHHHYRASKSRWVT